MTGNGVNSGFVDEPHSGSSTPEPRSARPKATLLRFGRVDAHEAAAFSAPSKRNGTIDEREERVVLAQAHIRAGVELSSELANQDVSSADLLPRVPLHTAPLRIAVAAVPGATLSFLMSHDVTSTGLGRNPDRGPYITFGFDRTPAELGAPDRSHTLLELTYPAGGGGGGPGSDGGGGGADGFFSAAPPTLIDSIFTRV